MEHARTFPNEAKLEPGVIASGVYREGRRVGDIAIDEAANWAGQDGHVVWIGLLEPDRDLLLRVQRQFGLHDLAIEDAEHPHARPKVEQYGDALFIVARTAQLVEGRVAFGETHIFVGRGFIVSIRHGASASYGTVRKHWESCPSILAKGQDFILYAILDFIVDQYMPVIEAIGDEVEEIEDMVLVKPMAVDEIERLYVMRRDLQRLRNAAAPLVDVCRRLTSPDIALVGSEMHSYFRDVTDHIRGVQEKIDNLREVLAFAFETSLLMGQNQANVVTKKLASWAAILAVPTAIAGIYGMNFADMPELEISGAYHLVVLGMFSVCALLYWRFKQTGWL